MSDNEKKQEKERIINIDKRRVEKLEENGHYFSLLEQFDSLYAKLMYTNNMTPQEGIRFITLCKYLHKNGHMESLRLRCKYLLDKYVKDYGL